MVDECHHYRGVFGAHVAQVLRRLRRVCAAYGAHADLRARLGHRRRAGGRPPRRLTGADVVAVTDDGSPRGEVALALWEPPFTLRSGENGAPVRRAAVARRPPTCWPTWWPRTSRTLAFVRSRRGAEQVALTAAELLAEVDPALPGRVASYRGGYLPEERRALEAGAAPRRPRRAGADQRARARHRHQRARRGADRRLPRHPGGAVAAGGPGRARRPATRSACWSPATTRSTPTWCTHPEALFGRPVEATVFDPDNPYVLGPHLCAAAQERAAAPRPTCALFGPTRPRRSSTSSTDAGLLRRRPRGWFWTDRRRAADLADIRSAGGSAGAAGRGRHRPGGRHRRRRRRPRRRPTPAPSTCTAARPGWSTALDLDDHVADDRARPSPAYSTSRARGHRHRDRRRAGAPRLGRAAGSSSARST